VTELFVFVDNLPWSCVKFARYTTKASLGSNVGCFRHILPPRSLILRCRAPNHQGYAKHPHIRLQPTSESY